MAQDSRPSWNTGSVFMATTTEDPSSLEFDERDRGDIRYSSFPIWSNNRVIQHHAPGSYRVGDGELGRQSNETSFRAGRIRRQPYQHGDILEHTSARATAASNSLSRRQAEGDDFDRASTESNPRTWQRRPRHDFRDHALRDTTNRSSSPSRHARDALFNETGARQFSQSQDLLHEIYSPDVTPPYATHLSQLDLLYKPGSNAHFHNKRNHDYRSEHVPAVRLGLSEGLSRYAGHASHRDRSETYEPEPRLRGPRLIKRTDDRVQSDSPRNSDPQEEANGVQPSRQGVEVAPAARQRSSTPVEAVLSAEQHGHECDLMSLSTTTDDTRIDDEEDSGLVANSLSENVVDLPLASRTSAAIFTEAQSRLERLLLDLQSFEDDYRDKQSISDAACSAVLEAEDPCDGHENGAQSRQASGSTVSLTDTGGREHHRSGRKRQRSENGNEEHSRATTRTTHKKPASSSKQMLICCFRDDPQAPCLGTDEYICDVISMLDKHHGIHVCNKCYVLLESVSGNIVHPSGDCVKHCLSPDCTGNSTPAIGQRHRHVEHSCPTRSKPCDRESIHRYIYGLVHPTHEQPDSVFTTGKEPHLGMRPRQGTRGPSRDELVQQARELTVQLEELRKRDSASIRQLELLTRDLETERRTNTISAEKIQRLQEIISDAIRPGALSDEHWRRSILQRIKMDAPGALPAHAPATQALQHPLESLPSRQDLNMVPSPSGVRTTGQNQTFRDVNLQSPSNDAASCPFPSKAQGKKRLEPDTPHKYGDATAIPPPGATASTDSVIPMSEFYQNPNMLWRDLRQDTPNGGLGFSNYPMNTDMPNSTSTVFPSEFPEDQVWTGDCLDGGPFSDEVAGTMAGPLSGWC